MTVQECYEKLSGNYEEARSRLMNDRLIEKFMLKFIADPTMDMLRDALKAENYEEAFRGAHTLKGVAANLAFSGLQASASALTERLRNNFTCPEAELVDQVETDYAQVIGTLKAYQEEKV